MERPAPGLGRSFAVTFVGGGVACRDPVGQLRLSIPTARTEAFAEGCRTASRRMRRAR